jgi:S1-C subfamily serine protease
MRLHVSSVTKVIQRLGILLLTICCTHLSLQASARHTRAEIYGANKTSTANSLEQLSSSLQDVARRVEPAVVRILNSAYAAENDEDHSGGAVVFQQRSSGSGILVSSDGYIVTNAHVVQGARRLRVRLNKRVSSAGSHLVDARLIGMDRQTDLAVIKIDLTGLHF